MTQTIMEVRHGPEFPDDPVKTNNIKKCPLPNMLLRTPSIDRLKEFPSSIQDYFCRNGSHQFLKWLIYSRTYSTLSEFISQLRGVLLLASVYVAFGLVSLQLAICFLVLFSLELPLGLTFLLACISITATVAILINLKVSHPRTVRTSLRHVKHE